MLKYPHLLEFFSSQAWAMRPDKLSAITHFLVNKSRNSGISTEEIRVLVEAAKVGRPQKSYGAIAVLPVMGVISHRVGLVREVSEPQGASAEALGKKLEALVNNPEVGAIVLDIDSPGGTVSGVPELADQIFEARNQKKIIAVANAQAASAAYWIGSAASEFVVTPSGEVGSIGVFMIHQDLSERLKTEGVQTTVIKAGKYKAEGNPFMPLDPAAQAAFQVSVDRYYDSFVEAVARGRGARASSVRNGFGQGRMVSASEALDLGMVDRVATLDETLARLGVKAEGQKTFRADLAYLQRELEITERL